MHLSLQYTQRVRWNVSAKTTARDAID